MYKFIITYNLIDLSEYFIVHIVGDIIRDCKNIFIQ